jgi:hypothetical protein
MHNIQPDFDVLADTTDIYKDLSKRVKWVHQNLCVFSPPCGYVL